MCLIDSKAKSEKKTNQEGFKCFMTFNLVSYQNFFQNDSSQEIIFTMKDVLANDCKQLEFEG